MDMLDKAVISWLKKHFTHQDAIAGQIQLSCARGDAEYIKHLRDVMHAKDIMHLAYLIERTEHVWTAEDAAAPRISRMRRT